MKLIISNICVIMLVIGLAILCASCLNTDPASSDFVYKINDDKQTCTIIGLNDSTKNHIVVPSKIGKYTVNKIANRAFKGAEIKQVDLPDTIIEIGDEAFSQCYYLVNINLPSNLQKVGQGAFSYCSSLKSIEIPTFVTILPKKVFYECSALESVSLNGRIYRIEEDAFYLCSSLKQVNFPSTLIYIGDRAFMACYSLTKIALPKGLIDMGYNTFSLCTNLTEISLSSTISVLSIPFTMECPKLTSFAVDDANCTFRSNNGVLYNKSMSILAAYPSGKRDVEFDVPNTVNQIFNSAFVCNKYIQTINISQSVKSIGSAVFALCDNLNRINYNGTVEMWNSIEKHSGWDIDSPDYTIYCTDGTIAKDGTVTYK